MVFGLENGLYIHFHTRTQTRTQQQQQQPEQQKLVSMHSIRLDKACWCLFYLMTKWLDVTHRPNHKICKAFETQKERGMGYGDE